ASSMSISGSVTNETAVAASDGAIDISVSDGTPSYTYSWSNAETTEDLSGLVGGTYLVTVTDDNGCTLDESFTVNTVGAALQVSSIIGTDVNCNGGNDGTIDLEIIGGNIGSYTYDWDNDGTGDFDDPQDLSGLSAGTYTVIIDDGVNPTITTNITVNEPAVVLNYANLTTTISCNGESDGAIDLMVGGGTTPYSYLWSNGATTQDLTDLSAGAYTFTITDANGCTASHTLNVTEPDAIVATPTLTAASCDPGNNGAIDIAVSGGSPAYTFSWSNGATSEDISSLTEGTYSVTITDSQGCTEILTNTINSSCIGIAKDLVSGPTNNGDGSYALTFDIRVENSGNVDLSSVEIEEDLNTTFSGVTSFSIDDLYITAQPTSNTWTVNPNYDGDDTDGDVSDATDILLLNASETLVTGEFAIFRLELTVFPGAGIGTYNNTASARGESAEGVVTTDDSEDGTDPDSDNDGNPGDNDTPTPITFSENPEIGIAKTITDTPTNNQDGTFSLSYLLKVENTGDVNLSSVQVVDDLSTTFSGLTIAVNSLSITTQPPSTTLTANSSYDGDTDKNLLSGTNNLNIGEYAEIEIAITVTLNGSSGPFSNSATTTADGPGGTSTSDTSQDGSDVDPDNDGPGDNSDPTTITFNENPEIGAAKELASTPINNEDGTHTLSYNFRIENTGDVPLEDVQLVDQLSNTFSGLTIVVNSTSIITQPNSENLTLNGSFDGNADANILSGINTLNVGEYGIVSITLTVTLIDNLGPFTNTAVASGTSGGGTTVSDDSQNGTDVDPDADGPNDNSETTPVTFTENPSIGAAKVVSNGPTNNENGTYTLTYTIYVSNYGDVPLTDIQVTDDLSATFSGLVFIVDDLSSTDFTVNALYNGVLDQNLLTAVDNLAVDASGSIDLTLTITPASNLGPYSNTANTSGTSPGNATATDASWNSTDPDPDNDGDPTNNDLPTTFTFTENP
ncbi:MAG: hypothetical protein GQ527_05265, partial [Bacteroidales bacterium]|nr:hypothetical protein [Bacteroidales bacterium]